MLLLTEGDTAGRIVVTLAEKVTLANPFYLFVFTHITTKEVVKVCRSYADDLSNYPSRYNEFAIDATVFPEIGQWLYRVYEASEAVSDETGLNEVESGKLNLLQETALTYKQYQPKTTFTTYAG